MQNDLCTRVQEYFQEKMAVVYLLLPDFPDTQAGIESKQQIIKSLDHINCILGNI